MTSISITKKGASLHLCFVDFKKAYDSVWRDGLFYKLLKSGVRGKTFNVIQSMYSQSECYIKINGDRTDFMSDSIGVKQGEVLSPLLFNLFINDLVDAMNVSDSPSLNDRETPCLLYADERSFLSHFLFRPNPSWLDQGPGNFCQRHMPL